MGIRLGVPHLTKFDVGGFNFGGGSTFERDSIHYPVVDASELRLVKRAEPAPLLGPVGPHGST